MVTRAEEVLARRMRLETLGSSAIEEDVPDRPVEEQLEIFNADDPKAIKEKRKRRQYREGQNKNVITDIMATTQGRAWLGEILIFCDVMGNAHVQGSADGTAFNLGMQNVGKMILDQIFEAVPEKYAQMLREAKKRQAEE